MDALLVNPEGFKDLGWQISYVVILWVGITSLVLTVIFAALCGVTDISGPIGTLFSGFSTLILAGLLLVPFLILGPEFMKDYEVRGTVISATNKFDSGTGDLTSIGKPVVRLEGLKTPLFVGDDRILGMVGEEVVLRCQPVWRYHADAYYSCEVKTFNS